MLIGGQNWGFENCRVVTFNFLKSKRLAQKRSIGHKMIPRKYALCSIMLQPKVYQNYCVNLKVIKFWFLDKRKKYRRSTMFTAENLAKLWLRGPYMVWNDFRPSTAQLKASPKIYNLKIQLNKWSIWDSGAEFQEPEFIFNA